MIFQLRQTKHQYQCICYQNIPDTSESSI
uniref:Uncharacterized protein n=1 Tax=Rhizophora mucronata TaxID=61149 RepID=A0A2P2QEK5_RHIMU